MGYVALSRTEQKNHLNGSAIVRNKRSRQSRHEKPAFRLNTQYSLAVPFFVCLILTQTNSRFEVRESRETHDFSLDGSRPMDSVTQGRM